MAKQTRKNQSGGGTFFEVLKGTMGYFAAMFIYGIILLFIIGGFIGGVFLFLSAKNDLCTKKVTTTTTNANGVQTTEEICVETKPASEGDVDTQVKYYGGITMIIIFGLLLLFIMLPYIINAIGYALGSHIVDEIIGK